jgi:DNA polymerase
MSSGLEAIANELRRLQRDGVDRVFVEDSTLSLLAAGRKSTDTRKEPPREPVGRPGARGDLGDLRELTKDVPGKAVPPPATTAPKEAEPLPVAPQIEVPGGDAATQLAWLRERVLACEVCQANLNEGAQIVFGTGSPEADIFFCGEAPGAEEEDAGEPFVGQAGQLLTKIISAMGLSREDVYLANILKWRPQHDKPYGNRPPSLDEMRFCLPYLQAQISIIRPKIIVALGHTTVTGLLGADPERKMGKVRGTWVSFDGTPVMVSFHPSYLLRNGTLKTKRLAWEDMLQVMERCGIEISAKQRGFFLPKS